VARSARWNHVRNGRGRRGCKFDLRRLAALVNPIPEPTRWPIVALIVLGAIAAWSTPFIKSVPLDYHAWLLPWYEHIVSSGPVGAFSHPFGNYTPPYLYLLSAVSILGLPPFFTIKTLSALGAFWLAFAIYRLLSAVEAPRPVEAAAWSLFLPSIVFNVPIMMQADAFWVAPCVLGVTAAIRRDYWRLGVWASIAFAFKAQSIFLAPFVISAFMRERVPWYYWLTPLCVYVLAMLPAWLAGWPAWDLLTVYIRQAQWQEPGMPAHVSNAANIWLLFALTGHRLAEQSFAVGFAAAIIATVAYIPFAKRALPIAAAALSAIMIPWLLPGMHERFFVLAEILTYCLAWQMRQRAAIGVATLTQLALVLLLVAMYLLLIPLFVAAVAIQTAALIILWRINAQMRLPHATGAHFRTSMTPISSA
jgi:Gpi18-like mannosyltransferase